LLEHVIKDLKSIQDLVLVQIRSSSDSMDDDIRIIKDGRSACALLLLLTAGLGSYDLDRIKPVGVALELLNLGIKKHFSKDSIENMGLIVSDHYFATALNIVVKLDDNWIVGRLSDALQEVADGQVVKDYYSGLKSRCAFYQAACDIGARSSGLPRTLREAALEFSLRLGMAMEARNEMYVPQLELADLVKKAYNALTELPAPAVSDRIKEVTDAVVFSQ